MNKFLDEYVRFAEIVNTIKKGSGPALYVGSGSESQVWRIEEQERLYAVKIANSLSIRGRRRDTAKVVMNAIMIGERANGIAGLEQLCAASPETGATIYDFASGQSVTALDEAFARNNVTDEQIDTLIDTVAAATEAGLMIDGLNDSGANAFYDDEAGFTLIDFRAANENLTFKQNMKYALRSLGRVGLVLAERTGYQI